MRARATAVLLGLVGAALLLTACGGGSSGETAPAPTAPSTSATPAWNPCDALRLPPIERALGARLRMETGTADAPRCTLVPRVEGGAAIDANYLPFPEGLDAAWDQMGAPDDGSVRDLDLAGADAARLVVDSGTKAAGVTGFVQTGELVEIVNGVDTAPYDEDALARAVRVTMEQLAAGAPQT